MATVRLVKTRDNGKMIRQLREARKGTSEVQTVEIRETVLDDEVIKEIIELVTCHSIETVQVIDCHAYLNKQAIRMAQVLGNNVKNVRLSGPTFLSQFFLDKLLMSGTELTNLRIQGHLHHEQIQALSRGLKETKSLETLDLGRSRIDNFSVLAEGLKLNSSIQILGLRSVGLRDENVEEILEAISTNPSLKSIDLSFNHCHRMDYIARFIETTNITDLHLGYQNVWQAPRLDISGLTRALANNQSIRTLSLAQNKLNDEDSKLLSFALLRNMSLTSLNLKKNNFSDVGIVMLANALEKSIQIRECSFVNNSQIGNLGLEALLKAARSNHNLFRIELTDNGSISRQIRYETALNRGGRKLLFEKPPISLWPLALERLNKLDFMEESNSDSSSTDHRYDALFNLLKGPAIFEGFLYRNDQTKTVVL